jgi:hypothetical protein
MAKRVRHLIIQAVVCSLVMPAAIATATSSTPPVAQRRGPADSSITRLSDLDSLSSRASLPSDGTSALISAIRSFSARLGYFRNPTKMIKEAALTNETAGSLSMVVDALRVCHDISASFVDKTKPSAFQALTRSEEMVSSYFANRIEGCSEDVLSSAMGFHKAETERENQSRAIGHCLDVWPVVIWCFEGGNEYLHDYALIIDGTFDSTYANNAGGNLLDVMRGPAGSPAPITEPARGCQRIFPDLTNGDCIVSSALVIDQGGNDTYGVMQAPDSDSSCTSASLIRRIVTVGAGLAGFGGVLDFDGDDAYTGKTITEGAGHVGGVGVLFDSVKVDSTLTPVAWGDSDDTYLAIRNGQGFALVSGIGLLSDNGGDDTFGQYMPPGGVINDIGVCDAIPRFVQGAGNLGGSALFLNVMGVDSFSAPPQRAQGYGEAGGSGLFLKYGNGQAEDTYQGPASRGNETHAVSAGGVFLDTSLSS